MTSSAKPVRPAPLFIWFINIRMNGLMFGADGFPPQAF